MSREGDLSITFWKKWIDADSIEQTKMLEEVVVDAIFEMANFKDYPDEKKKHLIAMMLNGYFEDLYFATR